MGDADILLELEVFVRTLQSYVRNREEKDLIWPKRDPPLRFNNDLYDDFLNGKVEPILAVREIWRAAGRHVPEEENNARKLRNIAMMLHTRDAKEKQQSTEDVRDDIASNGLAARLFKTGLLFIDDDVWLKTQLDTKREPWKWLTGKLFNIVRRRICDCHRREKLYFWRTEETADQVAGKKGDWKILNCTDPECFVERWHERCVGRAARVYHVKCAPPANEKAEQKWICPICMAARKWRSRNPVPKGLEEGGRDDQEEVAQTLIGSGKGKRKATDRESGIGGSESSKRKRSRKTD